MQFQPPMPLISSISMALHVQNFEIVAMVIACILSASVPPDATSTHCPFSITARQIATIQVCVAFSIHPWTPPFDAFALSVPSGIQANRCHGDDPLADGRVHPTAEGEQMELAHQSFRRQCADHSQRGKQIHSMHSKWRDGHEKGWHAEGKSNSMRHKNQPSKK